MLKQINVNLIAHKILLKKFILSLKMKLFIFVNVSKDTNKVKMVSVKRSLILYVLLNYLKFHQFHAQTQVFGIQSTINAIVTHHRYFSLMEHASPATNIRHGTVKVVYVNQVTTLSIINV